MAFLGLNFIGAAAAADGVTFGARPGLEGNIRRSGGVGSPVIAQEDDLYYIFTGGNGINIRQSNDLVEWSKIGTALPTSDLPSWAREEFPRSEKPGNSLWAPDISYFNGQYHLYYAVSTLGSSHSAIGFATSPTLDPASPAYGWTDRGSPIIVTQHRNAAANPDHFNAIDPNVTFDEEGNPWMVFGSYWSGVKLRQLDPNTGGFYDDPLAGDTTLYSVARRDAAVDGTRAVEAPFIVHADPDNDGGWYYLFVSFDPQPSEYNVRVGRSRTINGTYLDFHDVPLTEGGGTLVLAGYADILAPGHNGVLQDDRGKTWMVRITTGMRASATDKTSRFAP